MRPKVFASMLSRYDYVRAALKQSLSEVLSSIHRIGVARKPGGVGERIDQDGKDLQSPTRTCCSDGDDGLAVVQNG